MHSAADATDKNEDELEELRKPTFRPFNLCNKRCIHYEFHSLPPGVIEPE